jgi:alanine-synthesizing transaminase
MVAPSSDFSRIQRLPPYVFNIVNELKAAARARGEDIIDFGMGNPDQPTPKHIVDKLVEAAQRERHPSLFRVPRHSAPAPRDLPLVSKRYAWISTRTRRPSSPSVPRKVWPIWPWRPWGPGDAVLVPNPAYPDSPLRLRHRRGRHPPCAAGAGGRFFRRIAKRPSRIPGPSPKMLVLNFPATPPPSASNWISSSGWSPWPASMASGWFMTWPTPISSSTATSRALHPAGAGRQGRCRGIFTLSKSYNMPGWRVGFMCGNPTWSPRWRG